jgi:glycosyltransferase involved in cell wall biosynthesis
LPVGVVSQHCLAAGRNCLRFLHRAIGSGVARYRYARYSLQIRVILRRHRSVKGAIIYPPYVSYSLLRQRPHQLGMALAEEGYLFFFCTTDGQGDGVDGFRQIEGSFYLSSAPLEIFRAVKEPTVYISYAPFWRQTVEAITGRGRATIFYDWIDDLAVFGPVEEQITEHRELLQSAEVVAASASMLYSEALQARADVLLIPNGVRVQDFENLEDRFDAPPLLRSSVDQARPVIGYYGSISSWVDFDLLQRVLQLNPKASFIIIGHVWGLDEEHREKWSVLQQSANLIYIDHVDYNELRAYLRWFDVAIIPFCLNEITHATSPVKLFEYMAAGKPIVTTGMFECKKYKSVLWGNTPEEFSDRIRQGLDLRKDQEYLALLRKEALENTWAARAVMLDDAFSTLNGKANGC